MSIFARDKDYNRSVQQQTELLTKDVRYHSIQLPDGRVLPGIQSIDQLKKRMSAFNLPEDLSGKRVIDIGAWDGWFSFECERRGAEVLAVDCMPFRTFLEARYLLGSKVDYAVLDVEELDSNRLGKFDIVLFLGVLYHLRHPLLGLEKVLSLTRDIAIIESFVTAPGGPGAPRLTHPVMEFYETDELGGQIDNWFGPSSECLVALCRSAGFAEVTLAHEEDQRASVVCTRRWRVPAGTSEPAPVLYAATNNRNFEARFCTSKDEYLLCFFRHDIAGLTRNDVFVEVDGMGTPALAIAQGAPFEWQVNCVRPRDLTPGRHFVRLRTRASEPSNAVEILVDTEQPELLIPKTSSAARPTILSAVHRPAADFRFTGLGEIEVTVAAGEPCSISSVAATLDGQPCRVRNVNYRPQNWVLKIEVPDLMASGVHLVQCRTVNSEFSAPAPVDIVVSAERLRDSEFWRDTDRRHG